MGVTHTVVVDPTDKGRDVANKIISCMECRPEFTVETSGAESSLQGAIHVSDCSLCGAKKVSKVRLFTKQGRLSVSVQERKRRGGGPAIYDEDGGGTQPTPLLVTRPKKNPTDRICSSDGLSWKVISQHISCGLTH